MHTHTHTHTLSLSLSLSLSHTHTHTQDPNLFAGPLVAYLDPFGIHDEQGVWQALEQVNLKTFFASKPDGLRHELSEVRLPCVSTTHTTHTLSHTHTHTHTSSRGHVHANAHAHARARTQRADELLGVGWWCVLMWCVLMRGGVCS